MCERTTPTPPTPNSVPLSVTPSSVWNETWRGPASATGSAVDGCVASSAVVGGMAWVAGIAVGTSGGFVVVAALVHAPIITTQTRINMCLSVLILFDLLVYSDQ